MKRREFLWVAALFACMPWRARADRRGQLMSQVAPPAAAGGGASASDDFNRANENPIGGNWTASPGSSGSFQVLSNQLKATADGDRLMYWNAASFADNQYSQITIATVSVMDGGAAFRVSSSALTGYVLNGESGGTPTAYRISKFVAGTFSQLAVSAGTWAGSDTMRGEATGTTIALKKNGAQVLSVTDASISSGTPGVFIYESGVIFDNWTGGDI